MRYLYYCNSTYQLINILNLHSVRKNMNFENIDNYCADLVILNAYNVANSVANVIRESGTFECVRVIERVRIKGRCHTIKTIRDIVFPLRFLNRDYNLDGLKNRYDCICTPKFNRFVAATWQINRKSKLDYIEDGLDTYFGNIGYKTMPKSYRFLYKLFNNNRDFDDIRNIYVNSTKLFVGEKIKKTVQIPKMSVNFINHLLEMFKDYINVDLENKKIYYLSQHLNYDSSKYNVACVCNLLSNYKSNVLFCPHPRNKVANVYNLDEVTNGQIWELKLKKISNINSKCLISTYSTACFSPKLLFDMEPYIILTYCMADDLEIKNRLLFDKLIINFTNLYMDKSKIMIPKTIEEFNYYLTNTINKINENGK